MTSRFLSHLDTRLIDEAEGIHVVLADFRYWSDLLGHEVIVPAGFRTDFASVPRLVGAYLLFGGKGIRAAVIHDWLYSGGIIVTRETADAVFKEALLASLKPDGKTRVYGWFTIQAMYQAVRAGGQARFNSPNLPQREEVLDVMESP